MIYIVFSEGKGDYFEVAHASENKSDAIVSFTEAVGNACAINKNISNVYLVGFTSDETPGMNLVGKTTTDFTKEDVINIRKNLDQAVCLYTLFATGYKTKSLHTCDKCSTATTVLHKNAFGEQLCDSCWASYLASEQGLVEYYLGIASGVYKVAAFTAGEKAAITQAWTTYRANVAKTEEEKVEIETIVNNLIGLA